MFKGGSHWVSARMSAGNEERERQARAAVAVALEAEVRAAAAGDEPNASPLDVPDAPAPPNGDADERMREQTGLDSEPLEAHAPPRPMPLLAPANFLQTSDVLGDEAPIGTARADAIVLDEAPAHEAPVDEPRQAERPAPAATRPECATPDAAALAVEDEQTLPKFLDEPEEDRPSARQSAWVVLSAVTVLTAFVVGALGVGLPDAGERLATLNGARVSAEGAQLMAAVERLDAPHNPEPAQERDNQKPDEEGAQHETASRMRAISTLEQRRHVSPMRFRDAIACSDAASCGVPLWAAPRREIPESIEPALGPAVAILNRARLNGSGRVSAAGVPAVDGGTSVSFRSASEEIVAENRAGAAPIALGDIGQVEIVLLPRGVSNTGGTQVALRARDGSEVARFDLKVPQPAGERERAATDEDGAGEGAGDAIAPLGPPAAGTAPSASLDQSAEPGSSRALPGATPARTSGKAARPIKGKASPGRAKQGAADEQKNARPATGAAGRPASQDAEAPARQTGAAPVPRGLFTFELPSAGASLPQAAPVAGKAPETSPNDIGSQRTPQTLDQAPGMETLMGLGGFGLGRP